MSTNPLEALLLATAAANRFPPNSRYHGMETSALTQPDGAVIPYLRRRFVPQPEALALLRTYAVQEGDRLDNVTARLIGDPEMFWRICDGNRAVRPDALVEPVTRLAADGTETTEFRTLRITQPEGVPGVDIG
jgi:hypothetical protein